MTKTRMLPQPVNPVLGGNDLTHIGDNTNFLGRRVRIQGRLAIEPPLYSGQTIYNLISAISANLYPNTYGSKTIHITNIRAVVEYPTLS